jgi:hypothetical protein
MFQVDSSVLSTLVVRPETFLVAYGAIGGSTSSATYIRSQLGAPFSSLSDAGCMAIFAVTVAFNAAPAGSTTLDPLAATLQQLLSAPALASAHFCKLATLLSLLGSPALIPPDAAHGSPPKATIHPLVWLEDVPLNTAVHSQIVISNVLNEAYLLLDPMYAYALRIPFVGAGPQGGKSDIENAALMMQTPIAPENLAVLDPAGTASVPEMLQTVISGTLGPQYLELTTTEGSENWDTQIARVFDNMG